MTECILCGGATREWLTVPDDWRRRGQDRSYPLRWCELCAFGAVLPRPSAEEIVASYLIDDYHTHVTDRKRKDRATLQTRVQMMLANSRRHGAVQCSSGIDLVEKHEVRRVCDIGCGGGAFLQRCLDIGCDVVGIEPDPDARATAASRGVAAIDGTAERLPTGLGPFGLVRMMHVLEHCPDPVRALSNAAQLLEAKGRIICEVPNNGSAGAMLAGANWPWLDVPRHLNFFTLASLRSTFAKCGLEVETVTYGGYARQFSTDWIEVEKKISALFDGKSCATSRWWLLARTILSKRERKFDSVRLIGKLTTA